MHKYILPVILTCFFLVNSCKKNQPAASFQFIPDSTHIQQTVVYRVKATDPSPYDLAYTPSADSLILSFNRLVGAPDYLDNTLGLSWEFSPYGTGFGFQYLKDWTNPGTEIFSIGFPTIPQLPVNFELNKVYSNTRDSDFQNTTVLVSMQTGQTFMTKYFTGATPPDAVTSNPRTSSYCQIEFSKKNVISTLSGIRNLYDGVISGYTQSSWGITDPKKYVQRWDYNISFSSLRLSAN